MTNIFQKLLSLGDKPTSTLSSDREKMAFSSEPDREMISAASHAQASAAMLDQATSQEMRKSADALASLARGFQDLLG